MPNIYGEAFSNITNYVGVQKSTIIEHKFWQTNEADGMTEYSTIGPDRNETFTTYSFDKGTHHIRFLAYVSPDILLVHQSKVAGFFRAVDSGRTLEPYQRSVKDQLLKDTNMRISTTTISVNTSTSSSTATTGLSSGYSGY